jgi:hypothetical protein
MQQIVKANGSPHIKKETQAIISRGVIRIAKIKVGIPKQRNSTDPPMIK